MSPTHVFQEHVSFVVNLYSTKHFQLQILEIEGSEVLSLNLTLYNNNTEGERYEDMANVDMLVQVEIGKIRVTFLNKYVTDLLVSIQF